MAQDTARDGGAALETEFKLTGSPADLRNAFDALNGGPETVRRLHSTYHDTANDDLWRRGLTLRVRDAVPGAQVTLKEEAGANVERREWTVAAHGGGLDAYRFPGAIQGTRVAGIAEQDLVPRFETDVMRRSKDVCFANTRAEVSLDAGCIAAPGRRVALAELEFELVRGSATAMLAAARRLVGPHRLTVGSRSKAARGMALLGATSPTAKAVSPAIRPSDTVGRAFGKVVCSIAAHLMGNVDAAVAGEDPEGVHQLRVGLRRLRCALLVFGHRSRPGLIDIDAAARHALRTLGRARDADVFLLETLADSRREQRLESLRGAAEAHRSRAYDDVRRLLADEAFNTLLIDVMATSVDPLRLLDEPSRPLIRAASATLAKRHGKIVRAGAAFATLTAPRRHRVRIAVKKLRYACAYLAGLYENGAAERYLACLARLQQQLGLANDAIVADRLAHDLAATPDEARGAALVSDRCRDRLRGLEPDLRDAWDSFVSAKPFW
ncbi:MAG: CHAD domain-containing protein [Gammaproteobacteria bacterium]|nr:CHAD domain-containing protein [Gammaproteobacteria bacterium]